MFAKTRIEVLSLVFYFLLAFLLIAGYILLRLFGIDDETMKYGVIAGVTFFFGHVSGGIISSKGKPPEPPKGGPGI